MGDERQASPGAQVAGRVPTGPTAGLAPNALFEYLCRLGDDRLVLGHRTSQWCGHAPILEEDIALANFALDFVGQAAAFLKLAGEVEGRGRDEDALAFLRDEYEFRNVQLVELPIGDFAFTILREYLFDAFDVLFLARAVKSSHAFLAGIAAKALKEAQYHVRHSGDWVVRLGDGTEESHRRMQEALDQLWAFTGELFLMDVVDHAMVEQGIGVDVAYHSWSGSGEAEALLSALLGSSVDIKVHALQTHDYNRAGNANGKGNWNVEAEENKQAAEEKQADHQIASSPFPVIKRDSSIKPCKNI